MFESVLNLRRQKPLIHCITNPISINLCANGLLALGAQPIMAEHPAEVEAITSGAAGLLLNLGNITDARMVSMKLAAAAAKTKNLPILVDAVGIACSTLRRDYLTELLDITIPTVIKGNYSEIQALYRQEHHTAGVDADTGLSTGLLDHSTMALARQYGTIILASGKADIVTDGFRLVHIHNGTPQLTAITGTGCLLGAVGTACLAVQPDMEAIIAACATLGICAQQAHSPHGTGTFMANLLDALSTLHFRDLGKNLNMEEIHLENI